MQSDDKTIDKQCPFSFVNHKRILSRKLQVMIYVAWTLQKCRWVRVEFSKNSAFLKNLTQVRHHF
uniref:Putative ovule protein n=1 Tax=Solanum chacoense TaxID=4108 RepID=A0A0V0GHG3_SOLCH